jgi:hypothetical protein
MGVTKILPCVYRSQRDNVDLPGASCNTTSAVMALEASGFPPSMIHGLPDGKQPEDFLTELGDSPAAYEAMKTISPQFFAPDGKPTVRPPEAPLMLDWIVATAYNGKLLRYLATVMFSTIMAGIDAGRATLLRTRFTAQGHIVAVVGYQAVEDVAGKIGSLTALVVKDPWGNYMTGYKDKDGDGVVIPMALIGDGSLFKGMHLVVGNGS